MVDFDAAFLWESEALRSSTPRRAQPTRHPRHQPQETREDATWVTLRKGHERTGVPVSTLRKWATGGHVPTYMQETPVGEMRMISLQGVYDRAEELGRDIDGTPPSTGPAPETRSRHQQKPDRQKPAGASEEPDLPPGTTLVPLDAWNKMLLQLGNLHEAGQQLAEASARAAKAETEAAFLKERLAELREELARAREAGPSSEQTPAEPKAAETRAATGTLSVLRQIYNSWRRRPRG